MKKILLLLVAIFLATSLLANENLHNKKISIDFNVDNSSVAIDQITDPITGTKFIKNFTSPLWQITAKAGEKSFEITPKDPCDNFTIKKSGNKLVFTWKNIKNKEMTSGFDVVATVKIKDENSYWDFEVSKNDTYGIEKVLYPYVTGIEANNGDALMWPQRGGRLYTEFDNPKGFKIIEPCGLEYSLDIGFWGPGSMQLLGFTKNNASLYFNPEDTKGFVKTLNATITSPNVIEYAPRYYAASDQPGNAYKMPFPLNVAVVQGDWYNMAKKYRKWGIANNVGVFSNGPLEKRTDLPDWYKTNNVWMKLDGGSVECAEALVEAQKILDQHLMIHSYSYSEYPFDTHYPNWVPVRESTPKAYKICQDNNMHEMPYTNGHLVDTNLSQYYHDFGDVLVQKDINNNIYYEDWAARLGAKNASACIESPYYDIFKREVKKIFYATGCSAIYLDQVGGMANRICYNPLHHHEGNGYILEKYNQLIKDIRKEMTEFKGEGVPVTTEDCSEIYVFDGWLRCNDFDPELMPNPVNMAIYSDYVSNFGFYFTPDEVAQGVSGMNKLAIQLCKGYELGWQIGSYHELSKNKEFGEYFKMIAGARKEYVKYFNFGEMVRSPKITSPVPTRAIYYYNHPVGIVSEGVRDFPTLKTCAFNYKGKTMVCFCSVAENPLKVDWEVKACDLNLKDKNAYKITKGYSKGKKVNEAFDSLGEKGMVKSSFTIDPLDVVMFVVE